ncbi:A-kinase anchor protein 6 isoform 2-T2 [Menidia menidia]
MSTVPLSPVIPELPSPMLTSTTPTINPDTSTSSAVTAGGPLNMDLDDESQDVIASLCPDPNEGCLSSGEPYVGQDFSLRTKKPPPLHTGADWKVVLHLPEIEKWLRATGERVTQLTHSVGQDSDNRHVDVHLVQLKDICEDISDHVEQIHALLGTEFSLKLLSYSVNIIVDIRTVQLLWHQLRVSVLVLKERLLQGLQDSNGNFTRQTDILQAFSQDQQQTRLDALTDVDDCGQLTIRCSQDYFSLDCGITAFELGDFSPSEEPEVQGIDFRSEDSSQDIIDTQGQGPDPATEESEGNHLKNQELCNSLPELPAEIELMNRNMFPPMSPTMQCRMPNHSESSKRPLQGTIERTDESPTHPSLPKRAALFFNGTAKGDVSREDFKKIKTLTEVQPPAELSQCTSLVDPSDHSMLCLELDAVYPEKFSQSPESLKDTQESSKAITEHWYGSEEFLALPAQLNKTEMLAMKLESFTHSIQLRPEDSTKATLQDVDDWELTELNSNWDIVETEENVSTIRESGNKPPLPFTVRPHRQNQVSRFSPTSSSDIAPSLDESIESGPFSDLPSEEDEGRKSEDKCLRLPALRENRHRCASLVQQLLEDIRSQDKDPHIWRKIECFVQKLDGFILWLQEALDSTENWTQPRQNLDSLRVYVDTHLSFKLNVDSHCTLKKSIIEEGKELLSIITSKQSGLKDILQLVSSQWDLLQQQIKRQHCWMIHTLRCIQAQLFNTIQSQDPYAANSIKADLVSGQCEAQQIALEGMAMNLSSLHYPTFPSMKKSRLLAKNSLQEFETEYQELWDWLLDMDAMITDSHQLMMSEEQRHHLFKSSHTELMMMESKKTSLVKRAAYLRKSVTELPQDFSFKMHNLEDTWNQLEKILSDHLGLNSSEQSASSDVNTLVWDQSSAFENAHSSPSARSNSLLDQLEARIKELKTWLRETELLIFNSCLRRDRDMSNQMQNFKSLCSEIQVRRRGVCSVLKLCQKLLQQRQVSPRTEVGPDAEQHREALQLLSINLERRWEAIAMQALQWQSRLKKELVEQQVFGNSSDLGLEDHCKNSPNDPVAQTPEESWEWDETDMTITEAEKQEVVEADLMHNFATKLKPAAESDLFMRNQGPTSVRKESSSEVQHIVNSQTIPQNNNNIYPVYSIHNVELYKQPQLPLSSPLMPIRKAGKTKQQLLKSFSKDSSFSSIESLPDLLGGLMSKGQTEERIISNQYDSEGGRGSGKSENSRRSDCESGIVSDTGDTEIIITNGIQHEKDDQSEEEENDGKQKKFELLVGYLQKNPVTKYNQRSKTELNKKEKGWKRNELRSETRRKGEEEKRKKYRKGGGEAVEIFINGHGILTPADSDSDFDVEGTATRSSTSFMRHGDIRDLHSNQNNCLEIPFALQHQASSLITSDTSSLESLLDISVDLFSSKDMLQPAGSLENVLIPCHQNDEEMGDSIVSLTELNLKQKQGNNGSEQMKEKNTDIEQEEPSTGELSRRTLDLLKRLENIQSPLKTKMTRSVSDMTLLNISTQKTQLPVSPSLGGRESPLSGTACFSRKELPSVINESSVTSSLTEMSSTEDSSLGSEDFTVLRNHHQLVLDSPIPANCDSISYGKHFHNNSQRGQGIEEADAASLSMVVNVSCTSACTDEDEDNSDLLSSSTLTLTEEELGLQDKEKEEESLSGASTGVEDDDAEEMEGSYEFGVECMKTGLQSWIRYPNSSSSSISKTERDLGDEFKCGSSLPSFTPPSLHKKPFRFLNSSGPKFIEINKKGQKNDKNQRKREKEEDRRNTTRSYISQFVDDVENGNIDQSYFKRKDEDDEFLQEESTVFVMKEESPREFEIQDVKNLKVKTHSNPTHHLCSSPSSEDLPFPFKCASSLVGQLRGELPCHSTTIPSPPSLSPVKDCRSCNGLHNNKPVVGGRKAITIQEKFKFSSFATEETRKEIRANDLAPPKRWNKSHSLCCRHPPSSLFSSNVAASKKEDVHDFAMEIIDMAQMAMKSKDNQAEEPNQSETSTSVPNQVPTSLGQIRDKVLEHSHRPVHLRKGDFYSYLSLSSHDSDCGEVSQCSEDKSPTSNPNIIPSYVTPVQELHSTGPRCKQETSISDSADYYKCNSPRLNLKNMCNLDLKSTCIHTTCAADGRLEEVTSPHMTLPSSPDIRDEEILFSVCTEEVYLGPPLCYSMVLTKKPQRVMMKPSVVSSFGGGHDVNKKVVVDQSQDYLHFQGSVDTDESPRSLSPFLKPCYSSPSTSPLLSDSTTIQEPSSDPIDKHLSPPLVSSGMEEEKQGEDMYLCSHVAGGEAAAVRANMLQEEESHNEGPSYLNPRAHVTLIDSLTSEYLADTKILESNMGTVMTKISVCRSTTNPSKGPATTAMRINPQINSSLMKKADMKACERHRDVETQLVKQKEKKGWSTSQQEVKTAMVKQRPTVLGAGTSRIQL